MGLKLPTGSKLPRVFVCLPSHLLPQVESQSKFAHSGNAVHAYLHAVRRAGRAVALEAVPEEYRKRCERIDLEKLPAVYGAEVTLAYNWRTGEARSLGTALDRDYSAATEDEFVLTLDLAHADLYGGDSMAHAGDFKSGYQEVDVDTWQLKLGCLAMARLYKTEKATATIYQIKDDGSIWVTRKTYDSFDLDVIADQLADLARELMTVGASDATVNEGEHCRYCPAIRSCPAKREALSSLAGLEKYRDAEMVPVAELGAAWSQVVAAESLLKIVKANLKSLAQHTAIPTAAGLLEEVETRTERIDGLRGLEVIAAKWPEQAEKLRGRFALTKAAIKEEFGKEAKAVLQALDAGGALLVNESTQVRISK